MEKLTSDQLYKVSRILQDGHYGSFMSAIGCALQAADSGNMDKLYKAFGDKFEQVHAQATQGERSMSTIEIILNSLTLEQAQTWFNLTDKWVYIDDIILAPFDLAANNLRVNAIEDKFEQMLSQVNS
jgi:hypothetical protein